ncbi:MAG: arginine--tRNA ligase [Thermomicrobiales bacterium]
MSIVEAAKPVKGGIVAQEERLAAAAIEGALRDLGFDARVRDLRPVPFAGTWGVASSVCHGLAGEVARRELEVSGALDGLPKKEAKRLASEASRERAQALAEQVAAKVQAQPGVARVEAVNGFINVYFDANAVAARLIGEVLGAGERYGHGSARTDRSKASLTTSSKASPTTSVMVEHSQPNTHKAFHVGHLRNSCLGVAVSRIMRAAGYAVSDANYIGDIGLHVIKCLWCYERFHKGQEPAEAAEKGRWLGRVYAESDARLTYRQELIDFLHLLSTEDQVFIAAIDRMLKELYRQHNQASTGPELGEDVAYLLGVVSQGQELKERQLRQDDIVVKFWPIVGEQLRREVVEQKPFVPVEGEPIPSMTPEERLARWEEINAHVDWWLDQPHWQEEIKATWRRWEEQDPAFVALWKETREWSMADFRRIFDELGAEFDVWFFESEVEEEGRRIAKDLLEQGIAEISDGLPVVKIDEKLGLEQETYRTAPILRSDGTTLYATKDLALTRRKFEDYGVDTAIWVVDVRQTLYFQQVAKILEIAGFEQAKHAYHLGYEMVRLPEGIISSRKGNVPVYEDVRDVVLARAQEIIAAKNAEMPAEQRQQVARQIGIGSLKYAMLARDNHKVVTFDLEEALSFDGHAAPYIQYAHARACRILEHANGTAEGGRRKAEDGSIQYPALSTQLSALDFGEIRPEELSLLQQIAALPDEVQRAAAEYRPLLIANYVYELAKRFNDFYHACPVLQSPEPTRTARIAVVAATRQALANGLGLLAIAAPEAM